MAVCGGPQNSVGNAPQGCGQALLLPGPFMWDTSCLMLKLQKLSMFHVPSKKVHLVCLMIKMLNDNYILDVPGHLNILCVMLSYKCHNLKSMYPTTIRNVIHFY